MIRPIAKSGAKAEKASGPTWRLENRRLDQHAVDDPTMLLWSGDTPNWEADYRRGLVAGSWIIVVLAIAVGSVVILLL
jgi:hypothetical protein